MVITSESMMEAMLRPYFPQCRYLLDADMDFPRAEGRFSIEDSCYIESTGHFNAVELPICYNQLAYVFFGHIIRGGLVDQFSDIDFEGFRKNQLMAVITKMEGRFRGEINPRDFRGEIELKKTRKPGEDRYIADTSFKFWDKNSGRAEGKILLALKYQRAS